MFNLIRFTLCVLILNLPPLAQAVPSELDTWALSKASLLTQNCKTQNSFEWLKEYNRVDDELLVKIKKVDATVFAAEALDSSFLDFIEVFYPQDLPDTVPMSGAFLECSDSFYGFAEGKEKRKQNASLKAWAKCVNDEDEPTPFQTSLGKCLTQLKKK